MCTQRGVYCGSRAQFVDMVRAIEVNKLEPVIDERVFEFDQAKEAYQYQMDAKHFGELAAGAGGRAGLTRAQAKSSSTSEQRRGHGVCLWSRFGIMYRVVKYQQNSRRVHGTRPLTPPKRTCTSTRSSATAHGDLVVFVRKDEGGQGERKREVTSLEVNRV